MKNICFLRHTLKVIALSTISLWIMNYSAITRAEVIQDNLYFDDCFGDYSMNVCVEQSGYIHEVNTPSGNMIYKSEKTFNITRYINNTLVSSDSRQEKTKQLIKNGEVQVYSDTGSIENIYDENGGCHMFTFNWKYHLVNGVVLRDDEASTEEWLSCI